MLSLFGLLSYVVQKPSGNLRGKPISWVNGMVEIRVPSSNDSILMSDFRMCNKLYYSNQGHENITLHKGETSLLPLPGKYSKYCFILSGIYSDVITLKSSYDKNSFSLGVLDKNSPKMFWKSYSNLDQSSSPVNIQELVNHSNHPIVFLSICPRKSPKVNDTIVIKFGDANKKPLWRDDEYYRASIFNVYYSYYPYHELVFPDLPEELNRSIDSFYLSSPRAWIVIFTLLAVGFGVGLLLFDIYDLYPVSWVEAPRSTNSEEK